MNSKICLGSVLCVGLKRFPFRWYCSWIPLVEPRELFDRLVTADMEYVKNDLEPEHSLA